MALSYQQVFLKPRYSPYSSRSEISLATQFGPQSFRLPVVPANMKCTIDTNLARWMSQEGYFYIMHRFGTKDTSITPKDYWQDNYEFIQLANKEGWKTISISVGVQEEDKELLLKIRSEGLRVDYITIDIAHAHSILMEKMIAAINRIYARTTNKPFIIAGNVATEYGVMDLEQWGADAIKVGIAQGNACTTYGRTGFGVPMFSCMAECRDVATKPLIADGGIKTHGDFAKAIVGGGDMVMAGSFFASSIDSPAPDIREKKVVFNAGTSVLETVEGDVVKKIYFGSASSQNKHNNKHVEGRTVELDCDGITYAEKLINIEEHLQSAVSYAGGNLRETTYGTFN